MPLSNELAVAEEGYAPNDGVEDTEISAELHKQGHEPNILNPFFINSDSEAPEVYEKTETHSFTAFPQPVDIVFSCDQPGLQPESPSLYDIPVEGLLPPSLTLASCEDLRSETSLQHLPVLPDSQADSDSWGPVDEPASVPRLQEQGPPSANPFLVDMDSDTLGKTNVHDSVLKSTDPYRSGTHMHADLAKLLLYHRYKLLY